MSIEAMKRALKTFEKIHEGCGFVKEDDLHKDAKDLATYVQEDCDFTMRTLRQAIEQAEKQKPVRVCNTCDGTGMVKGLHNWKGGGKREQPCWACHEVADKKKESTPSNVDPRLLLGRNINCTKNIENRLCDLERRLAKIETHPAPPKREWIGLTDEEIAQAVGSPIDEVYLVDFRRVIEKLRSKNT